VVAGEAGVLLLQGVAEVVGGVAGRRDRLDLQALVLEGGRHHRQVEVPLVLDVIRVGVGAEDVGQPQAVRRDELEERREGGAGVDHDGGAAAALADDEGVREVAGMHASGEQHGR